MTQHDNSNNNSNFGVNRRTVLKGIGATSTAGMVGVPTLSGQVAAVHNGGLVARYRLDELANGTVEDTSGNDYDGTAVGDPQVTSGEVNQAFDFDGDDDQVTIDSFKDLSSGPVTVAAWVYPQSPPNRFSNVISLADETGSDRTNSVLIQHRGEDTGDPFLFGADDGSGSVASVTSGGVGTGEWHHVAVTQDGEYLTAYLDGSEIGSVSVDDHISVSTNVARIAQNAIGNSVTLYDAKIDDVRIYDRTLSAEEIDLLASNLVVPAEYDTIQNAIDDADPGDTIVVELGTYEEDVTVDVKGVTLVGPNAGTPGCGDRDEEATIEGRVVLSATGTTFDGFEVSPPPAEDNQESEAVRASNTPNDVTIQNNIVREFERDDPDGGFYGVDGINIFGGDGNEAIENATVRQNKVRNLRNEDTAGAAGISIQGNVDDCTVADNVVKEVGEEVTAYGFGVTIRATGNHGEVPQNVTVIGNDLNSVLSDPASEFFGVGVGIEAGGADYAIANNTIEKNDLGTEIKAVADGVVYEKNTICENTIDVVVTDGATDIEFIENEFDTVEDDSDGTVYVDNKPCTWVAETAWGEGEEFDGNSWGMYFGGGDGATAETDLVLKDGPDDVRVIGDVEVEENSDADITYTIDDTDGPVVHLAEVHFDSENASSDFTTGGGNPAPGQFEYSDEFEWKGTPGSATEATFEDVEDNGYFAAHAEVWIPPEDDN